MVRRQRTLSDTLAALPKLCESRLRSRYSCRPLLCAINTSVSRARPGFSWKTGFDRRPAVRRLRQKLGGWPLHSRWRTTLALHQGPTKPATLCGRIQRTPERTAHRLPRARGFLSYSQSRETPKRRKEKCRKQLLGESRTNPDSAGERRRQWRPEVEVYATAVPRTRCEHRRPKIGLRSQTAHPLAGRNYSSAPGPWRRLLPASSGGIASACQRNRPAVLGAPPGQILGSSCRPAQTGDFADLRPLMAANACSNRLRSGTTLNSVLSSAAAAPPAARYNGGRMPSEAAGHAELLFDCLDQVVSVPGRSSAVQGVCMGCASDMPRLMVSHNQQTDVGALLRDFVSRQRRGFDSARRFAATRCWRPEQCHNLQRGALHRRLEQAGTNASSGKQRLLRAAASAFTPLTSGSSAAAVEHHRYR